MVDEWYSLYLLHEVNLHLGLSNNLVDKVNGEYRGYLVHLPASIPPHPLQQQQQQQQKTPWKNLYFSTKKNVFFYFWMELSSPKPKRFLIYLKKNTFLIFLDGTFQLQARKTKQKPPWKNFLCFSKKHFPTFQDDCWSGIKTKNLIHTLGWLLIYSGMTAD